MTKCTQGVPGQISAPWPEIRMSGLTPFRRMSGPLSGFLAKESSRFTTFCRMSGLLAGFLSSWASAGCPDSCQIFGSGFQKARLIAGCPGSSWMSRLFGLGRMSRPSVSGPYFFMNVHTSQLLDVRTFVQMSGPVQKTHSNGFISHHTIYTPLPLR